MMKLLDNGFVESCNKYVNSGEYKDFINIFSIGKYTFDYVNNYCINLGRGYGYIMYSSTKDILYNLTEIIYDYCMNNLTTRDISFKYNLPRTSIVDMLGILGKLRSRSEAYIKSLETKRREVKLGNYYRYNYLGNVITLRSSYELAYLQMLINNPNVIKIDYESINIEYLYKDEIRRYIPDFLIKYIDNSIELHEVKPFDYINEPKNIIKFNAGIDYCNKFNYKFRIITESDIDWVNYPNYDDKNILNIEDKIKEPDGFITKVSKGTYVYTDHPRVNLEVNYKYLMDFINSKPKYSVSIFDIYKIISRNSIIVRLKYEAPDDEKDIRRWICKYLRVDDFNTNSKFDKIKLEYQELGIRDFGLKSINDIKNYFSNSNTEINFGDICNYLGYGINKSYRYVCKVLGVDPDEITEEINSIIRKRNTCI